MEDSGKGSSIDKVKKIKIKVIGIGGGAGMIVSEIASEIKQSCFVAANTDAQALKTISKKVSCFQFGQAITNGLGTGMNPEKGREAAQNEKERIKKLCLGQDICIIVACLGGGVGSGAAPVFAKISKNLGNLTYGIFTLPFKFEGEKKMEISRDALSNAKKHLNAMTIIPNERVFQVIDKETSLKQSFSFINKNLAENLKGLIEIIYNPGLINIDFADIQTIFEGQGRLVYLNTVESSKTQTDKDLIARLLSSPLYSYKIKGAKGVLFNIAGEKNLYLADVNQISKAISELVNPEAKIIFGISQKRKPSKGIKVFLLAIGCLEKSISKSVSKSVSKSLQDLENREDGHQKKKKRKREKINFPNLVRFGTIKQKKKTAFPNSFPNPKGIWNTPKGIRKTKVSKSAMDLEDSAFPNPFVVWKRIWKRM
ncbi:MAG: cell division FtsZ family protein [Candidatus Nealsonbacteria bacterium]|nr:cell division FtsZ family protein [Candidatus Nealsonbacteria bacterium]